MHLHVRFVSIFILLPCKEFNFDLTFKFFPIQQRECLIFFWQSD